MDGNQFEGQDIALWRSGQKGSLILSGAHTTAQRPHGHVCAPSLISGAQTRERIDKSERGGHQTRKELSTDMKEAINGDGIQGGGNWRPMSCYCTNISSP